MHYKKHSQHAEPSRQKDAKTTIILTIDQKMSGTGSIHDLASEHHDRHIQFGPGCKYAVVIASYYGGKGYTTHKTEEATLAATRKVKGYSYEILGVDGKHYSFNGPDLICLD